MDEWTALEMRHTGNRIQGSNPCLSATKNRSIGINAPILLLVGFNHYLTTVR